MKALEVALLLFRVALRNLWLYKVKTVVIGTLLAAGAFLAIVGLSLLGDVEKSMRESIIESVAGHLQIQSSKAKDDLALFGGTFFGRADVGTLSDFAPFRDVVLAHPNVEAFVPMGLDIAILGRGNEMDDVINGLRDGLATKDPAIVRDRAGQVTFQLKQLELELAERRKVFTGDAEAAKQDADVAKALEPAFFDALGGADAESTLQFLETRIAPLSGEKMPIYLSYLGVDVELHRAHFKKFKIEEGA